MQYAKMTRQEALRLKAYDYAARQQRTHSARTAPSRHSSKQGSRHNEASAGKTLGFIADAGTTHRPVSIQKIKWRTWKV